MTELHPVCSECETWDSIDAVPDPEMSDESQKGGRFMCRECGHVFGIWIDAGTIDLDPVEKMREAISEPPHNIQTFDEPWL